MNSFKGDNFTCIRQLFIFSFGYDGMYLSESRGSMDKALDF